MICQLYLKKVGEENHPKELQMKKRSLRKVNYLVQNNPANGGKVGLENDPQLHAHNFRAPMKTCPEPPEAQS